jgi:hypothetical protein
MGKSDMCSIRPAVAADFQQWLALWEGYQRFYKARIPMEVTQLTWARLMVKAGGGVVRSACRIVRKA